MDYGGMTSAFGTLINILGAVETARAANQQRKFQYEMGKINAQTQRTTLLYQADVADINAAHALFVGEANARIAEQGAQAALEQGQQQAGALTLRAGQLKSTQRASMAANGIDLGSGNAAEVQASTEVMKEIDKNTTTANATRAAWGYRVQSTEDQNSTNLQSLNYKTSADFARVASKNTYDPQPGVDITWAMAASGSMLTGAGAVAQNWYQSNKTAGTATPKETIIPDSMWSY